MADSTTNGRANQRRRTRKDLLLAASRLMKLGRSPSLDEIAEEALVSRATAYRYFPNVEGLLVEAALDVAIPEPAAIFENAPTDDAAARVQRVDTALHEAMLANETSMRMMLVHSLQRGLSDEKSSDIPARQNRRTPLIEAALAPVRQQLKPSAIETLTQALALIVGTEAMVVFKDVLQVNDATARKVKRWAIQALIDAAKK